MNRTMLLISFALIIAILLPACAGAGAPQTAIPAQTLSGTPGVAAVPQDKWDRVVAEARKEGKLTLYVSANWGTNLRVALTDVLRDRYGINAEFMPFGGSDIVARPKEEQRAGLFIADVFGAGTDPFLLSMKPAGMLGPLEPLLILPEVLDSRQWDGGQVFTLDKDHMMVAMLRVINRSIVYNKDMLKENDMDSYRDLLKPQFKGKLTITDPSQAGPGGWIINHFVDIYGETEGLNLLRDLLTRQETVVQRDARIHMETVARGKYAVAIGGGTQYIADFLALGAPIAIKVPKEGDGGGTSFGAVAVPLKSPHPNATTVFVNFLLTKDGQSLFAKYTGNPSRRLDASTEGVNAILMPLPGEKVAWDSEEFIMHKERVMNEAREILAQTQK